MPPKKRRDPQTMMAKASKDRAKKAAPKRAKSDGQMVELAGTSLVMDRRARKVAKIWGVTHVHVPSNARFITSGHIYAAVSDDAVPDLDLSDADKEIGHFSLRYDRQTPTMHVTYISGMMGRRLNSLV